MAKKNSTQGGQVSCIRLLLARSRLIELLKLPDEDLKAVSFKNALTSFIDHPGTHWIRDEIPALEQMADPAVPFVSVLERDFITP
jgi:hypothetical protein